MRRNLIIAIVAVVVIAGAATGIIVATSGGKKHNNTSATGTACSSSSSQGSSGSGGAPSTADARAVAECYLGDINKHDETHAANLICNAARSQWQRTINGSGGDFTVKIDKFQFAKSAAGTQPNSTDVTYHVDVSKGSQHRSSDLTFTVINEGGPKICDES